MPFLRSKAAEVGPVRSSIKSVIYAISASGMKEVSDRERAANSRQYALLVSVTLRRFLLFSAIQRL